MADIEIAKKSDLDNLATKTEMTSALNGKSNTNHTHAYSEITNKPLIPTKTSDLTNDNNFATVSQIPSVPTKLSELTNDSGFITGAYDNSASGLTATDIQSAIDELKSLIDGLIQE